MFFALLTLGTLSAWLCFSNGWILYFGDAEAHLDIARRIIDSRTPGYEQIGTVWLPLPHVLMLPFVTSMQLWRTGLAGTIPGVLCFTVAGTAFFAAAQRLFGSAAAALAGTCVLALNPNLLYLQSTPMTEPVLLAGLMGLLYFTVRFGQTRGHGAAIGAGLCSAAMSLTRYEGWFLIPFLCLYILAVGGQNRWKAAAMAAVIAAAAPLYWLLHNQWFYSNALEFYNGPYSARAMNPPGYPGQGDWSRAILYYRSAAELCAGTVTVIIGLLGLIGALGRRALWPVILFCLIPAFYVISIHGAGTPIFVPNLWPNSYYNSRYGIGILPLLAIGTAGLVACIPSRIRNFTAAALILAGLIPWLAYPRPENWITWKESEVNSHARRGWTARAGSFFATHYRTGSGIFFSWGDLTGVMREAGIPLKQTLHNGNGPHALAAQMRPDLFLWEKWVIAIAGDPVSSAMMKAVKTGPSYDRVETVQVTGGPVIEIYRRTHDYSFHQGARRPQ